MTMPSLFPPVSYPPAAAVAAPGTSSSAGSSDFSFHDLLDIVNPLQHLPIIGTLYRAITDEHIGKFEKLAGDTLYGGLWGAVSSVADLAFEEITGKDFGDTVLSLLTGGHDQKPVAVAQDAPPAPAAAGPAAAPAAAVPASAAPAPVKIATALPATPDVAAFSSALQQKGIDGELANRALFAYRQSMGLAAISN